ncbi:purine or other phosphorylase family 1 [Denitrovibrio acetiphilus DSM 12809]|jgi:futalosine hydrolase|uniref:Purine or other phosphorylase family 1 n=1 Tax=Denitrovibrio acetiphilus (strain DSM 12809 / NBRC 114555 / N2460) TaxID=522772 RepID=D4H134_DENA2|nr:purine or other phosphorylase family 1 [Denitrovibrio acetiphilus]ADD68697.1 purine or other phosphorylase family 1 [Denitrovibrio acetiphilus DSM 12809]
MKAIFVPSLGEAGKIFPNVKFTEWKHGIMQGEFRGYPVFITGVSKTPVTFAATAVLGTFDISEALLTGVCGAYRESGLSVGDVISVEKDYFADEGLYTELGFESLFKMGFGFMGSRYISFSAFRDLPVADSNTVSFLDGEGRISEILQKSTGASVENMEGAAFGYVCNMLGIKSFQVRGVSNFCGNRTEQQWNFKKAAANLERVLDLSFSMQ